MHRIRNAEYHTHHVFSIHRDACIWCGMTRQDIVEFGESKCPRREPLPLGDYVPLPRYDGER